METTENTKKLPKVRKMPTLEQTVRENLVKGEDGHLYWRAERALLARDSCLYFEKGRTSVAVILWRMQYGEDPKALTKITCGDPYCVSPLHRVEGGRRYISIHNTPIKNPEEYVRRLDSPNGGYIYQVQMFAGRQVIESTKLKDYDDALSVARRGVRKLKEIRRQAD